MDRSSRATFVRAGARLVAALLPLAAVAAIRALPALQAEPLSWVVPGVAATAAILAGLALLVAVAVTLEGGRVRDLADMAGLGMLATAFTILALHVGGMLALGVGVTAAAGAFLAGSLARQLTLNHRGARAGGIVIGAVLVEATLGGILLTTGWPADDQMASFPLAGGSLLLAVAALAGLHNANRAMALGLAASGALALAVAGTSGSVLVVGAAAVTVAAAVLGWQLLDDRLRRPLSAEDEPEPTSDLLLEAQPESPARAGEPEFDELARITRELRATLDDLVAARHLIELQRVEIDRASSIDALTGLASRWPTLDRLRTEAAEARRYEHPLAIVLLDIDGFADLNHDHGLQVGDAILREVALRLRVRMREADLVGRIGADAYLAILPHTDELGAATFARAVLDRLVDHRILTDRGEIGIGLSVGIALMRPGTTLSGEELLAAAEEALTAARAAGGNRIAFDQLHGLARLEERSPAGEPTSGAAEENA